MGRMSRAQLPHSLIIGPSLFQLILTITLAKWGVATALRERAENPDIKNARYLSVPQKLWTTLSSLAPSSLFAVLLLSQVAGISATPLGQHSIT